MTALAPGAVLLPLNQFDHFYLGGDRISALRSASTPAAGGAAGAAPAAARRPEEWIASTTTRWGEGAQGLSRLPDGTLLRDRVLADPVPWLGEEHVARYGGEGVELLVKLLDAGQRLPVHLHPTRDFARRHLGLAHGKTEAWVVVDATPGAVVGLGLRRPLSHDDVSALVAAHDSAALVDALHVREVTAGDGILVPAGAPHFIGAGVFLVEVQEPTDLSILLEWDGLAVDGDADGHLDLGFDVALKALDTALWSAEDVDRHVLPAAAAAGTGLRAALPSPALPYFRADHVAVDPGAPGVVRVPAGFAVLVVLDGAGELRPHDGPALRVTRGDVAVVPWCAGSWTLQGRVRGLLCRPPSPDAPPAPR